MLKAGLIEGVHRQGKIGMLVSTKRWPRVGRCLRSIRSVTRASKRCATYMKGTIVWICVLKTRDISMVRFACTCLPFS
jgi:hypothetical protein